MVVSVFTVDDRQAATRLAARLVSEARGLVALVPPHTCPSSWPLGSDPGIGSADSRAIDHLLALAVRNFDEPRQGTRIEVPCPPGWAPF